MTDVGLASATERWWPVVIIGAGPAGVAAAISAARDGARVLLVDRARFPRPKACGGCINPKALRRMKALGVADVLDKIGASTIDRLEVRARRARERSAVLRTGAGRAASRRALDAAMLDQARGTDGVNVLTETSATIEPRSEVTPASKESERRVALRTSHGETGEVRAGVVIAADGLRGSSLRKLDGFGVHVKPGSRMGVGRVFDRGPSWIEPGRVMMACHSAGYVGLVRTEHGGADVAGALDPAFVKSCGGPGTAVNEVLTAAGWPALGDDGDAHDGDPDGGWMGTGRLTRHRDRIMECGAMVIGDAAGYVEPFTGEGMAWAMESGMAAGSAACMLAEAWNADVARRWERAERRRMKQRQRTCRLVAALLRRPGLIRMFVAVAARRPVVARPFVLAVQGRPTPLIGDGGGDRRASGVEATP